MAALDDYLLNPNGNNAPAGAASAGNPAQMAVAPITGMTGTNPRAIGSNLGVGDTSQAGGTPPTFSSQVKGPFGTSGILGAVLGTVQDAVLHDIGVPSQYWSRVASARQADAVDNPETWAADPSGSYLKMAAQMGVPAADQHLTNMMNDSYRQAATAHEAAATANANAIAPAQQAEALFKAQAPAYNLAASVKDPATAQAVGATIRAMYARNGWNTSSLPTTDTPEGWQQFAAQAIPGAARMTADINSNYKDARLDQIDRSLDISQQRADDANARAAASGDRADARAAAAASRDAAMDPLREQLLQLQIKSLGGKVATQPQAAADTHNLRQAQANKLYTAKDGSPLPGYRNPHGLVFQGGDPSNRASWK